MHAHFIWRVHVRHPHLTSRRFRCIYAPDGSRARQHCDLRRLGHRIPHCAPSPHSGDPAYTNIIPFFSAHHHPIPTSRLAPSLFPRAYLGWTNNNRPRRGLPVLLRQRSFFRTRDRLRRPVRRTHQPWLAASQLARLPPRTLSRRRRAGVPDSLLARPRSSSAWRDGRLEESLWGREAGCGRGRCVDR